MKAKTISGLILAWLVGFSALAQDVTGSATAAIQGRTMEMETKLKMPNKYKQVSYMMGNEAGDTT